jgi:HKD family nuclease
MASLRGLHTKLYVADCGWQARLWTGSANATEAAFTHNVEFLVELRGKRADIGIDNLLQQESPKGQQDKRVRLRDLLVPYSPPRLSISLTRSRRSWNGS